METYQNDSVAKEPVGNEFKPVGNANNQPSANNLSMLGVSAFIVFVIGLAAGLICLGMGVLASSRMSDQLLSQADGDLVREIISYGVYFSCMTLLSVFFVEVSTRRNIKIFQYILIGAALCVNFLMLVAFSEKIPFIGAYCITSFLTTAQITLFVYQITKISKAAAIVGVILIAEFVFMLIIANLKEIALLLGSITLFVLISLAMYLTVKLSSDKKPLIQ